jgi:hypothetical protein
MMNYFGRQSISQYHHTSMLIQFHKRQDKPHTLRCIRQDGSVTWSILKTAFDIDHDLTHYAVEHTLQLHHAFYGLIANGVNINDWQLPKTQRPSALKWKNLPIEAQYSEIMVGIFQRTPDEVDFWESLALQLIQFNLPLFPNLSPKMREVVLLKMNELRKVWKNLNYDDILELIF